MQKRPSNRCGQALIIVLLVMAISLTLGVSVASRSISTLRQISFSAQSAKALAFAEAGVEEALKCLNDGSCPLDYDPPSVDLDGDGEKDFDYQISVLGLSSVFDELPPIERDKTIEVDLGGYPRDTLIHIFWVDRSISSQVNASSAIKASLIYCDDNGPTCTTKNYKVLQKAYDTVAERDNGISKVTLGSYKADGKTYGYRVSVKPPPFKYPLVMRLRFLYSTGVVSLAVQGAGGAVLPSQGAKVESVGFSGQVKRKVEVIRTDPALSTLFDFAILSGSDSASLSR